MSSSREFQNRLVRRARRAGVSVGQDLGHQLELYYRHLAQWNKKINLTGLDLAEDSPAAIDRLLIEPLLAAEHAKRVDRMIDIGSGGGSPAIPLALGAGVKRFILVESKVRKSVFLREALRVLGLTEGEVVTARYEELLTKPHLHDAHDLLTVRAVKLEAKALVALEPLVRPGGRMFLFHSSAMPAAHVLPPRLHRQGTHVLLEALRSQLTVLGKDGDVPRGTR